MTGDFQEFPVSLLCPLISYAVQLCQRERGLQPLQVRRLQIQVCVVQKAEQVCVREALRHPPGRGSAERPVPQPWDHRRESYQQVVITSCWILKWKLKNGYLWWAVKRYWPLLIGSLARTDDFLWSFPFGPGVDRRFGILLVSMLQCSLVMSRLDQYFVCLLNCYGLFVIDKM